MINVSNIERFATHDGPGIRTTIFLKRMFVTLSMVCESRNMGRISCIDA